MRGAAPGPRPERPAPGAALHRLCVLLVALAGIASAWPAAAALERSDACLSGRRREAPPLASQCFAIEHDGRRRTFRLHVPPGPARPMPLVLLLHGGGGSGAGMEVLTEGGFDRIADREHVLVAYPDGVGKGWNDGRRDLKSEAVREQVDDLGFLTALVSELARSYPVDATRVYAAGISNGGLMSYRLACDAADIFAAVAPVAANLSVELASRCHPSRPMPILITSGTEDPIMPWDGGEIRVLWMKRGVVLPISDTFARWEQLDHCGRTEILPVIDHDPTDGTSVVEHVATGCAGGSEVRLDEVRGGGHTWPDGLLYLGVRIVGRVSREIDANEAIWSFLSRFRRERASGPATP
jgi:polyhydroxybutyrate depolymerase